MVCIIKVWKGNNKINIEHLHRKTTWPFFMLSVFLVLTNLILLCVFVPADCLHYLWQFFVVTERSHSEAFVILLDLSNFLDRSLQSFSELFRALQAL